MSLIAFLNPPMFPSPDKLHLPMPEFPGDPDKLEHEVHKAITDLNLKAREFSSNKTFYGEYLGLITQGEAFARNKYPVEAHKAIWEATACVNRALESQAAGKFRKCIGWYLVAWLLGLAIASWWLKNLEGQETAPIYFGLSYWRYVVMGALGGVVIAIWGLMVHTANLDFDRHYSVWYWYKPVLGALTGLMVVITAQAGLLAIQGQGTATAQEPAKGKLVLYILAFLAGFSERFFVDIVDRVMTTMLSNGQSSSSSSKSKAAKTTTSGTTT